MTTLYVDDSYWLEEYAQIGITIEWGQRVIFVPRSELTLVQSSPTYIYTLDLNAFRLALKDLEDSAEGINYPDTHKHNTEVSISGIVLARVIEIINDYTVTFEDGNYAVNLIGANSNVADKINVNKVSVRSANSAGLVNPDIGGAVWNSSIGIEVRNNLAFLKEMEGGRWKIASNQMIFYKEDNVTEIARFDLKDSSGNPTMNNPMERTRV
jgi:hypothetical protein